MRESFIVERLMNIYHWIVSDVDFDVQLAINIRVKHGLSKSRSSLVAIFRKFASSVRY